MRDSTINKIKEILLDLNLKDYSIVNNEINVSSSHFSGIQLFFQIHDKKVDFYYTVRTSSWIFEGERTDLHDLISSCFALFLKFSDTRISCSLINITNPAVPELENEIYARYIIPDQYDYSQLEDEERIIKLFERLVLDMFLFEHLFWNLAFGINNKSHGKELEYSFELTKKFKKKIIKFYSGDSSINTSVRVIPNWEYVSDTELGLSIVKSKSLSIVLSAFFESLIEKQEVIKGINGNLIVSKEYKNFISYKDEERINLIFKEFGEETIIVLPLENKIVAVSPSIIVIKDSFCDFLAFKNEKEVIKNRHLNESKFLF